MSAAVGCPGRIDSSIDVHEIVLVQYTLDPFVGLLGVAQITFAVDIEGCIRGTVVDIHLREPKQAAT